jgi:hypothetical protein
MIYYKSYVLQTAGIHYHLKIGRKGVSALMLSPTDCSLVIASSLSL